MQRFEQKLFYLVNEVLRFSPRNYSEYIVSPDEVCRLGQWDDVGRVSSSFASSSDKNSLSHRLD